MDIPVKFNAVEPKFSEIKHFFEWRRHPWCPEIELYSASTKEGIREKLVENNHSWQWPYIWECGVVLARYILDNPHTVKDKIVYDFGTGMGTVAIAAKMAGAKIVVAVDTCVWSQLLVEVNSERNNVAVLPFNKRVEQIKLPEGCVVTSSDMIYGQRESKMLFDLMKRISNHSTVILSQSNRKNAFVFEDMNKGFFHQIKKECPPMFTPCLETGMEVDSKTAHCTLYTSNPLILQGS